MQKIRFVGIVFMFSLFMFSCIHSENKALLVGDWKGVEWLVNGMPSEYDAKKVTFHFANDGGYSSDFGGDKEKGTYILRDDKLFTTPDGQLEIMVLISKLTKDSLVFDMNRSGQSETLILIKK
jgi:hypothetical protein